MGGRGKGKENLRDLFNEFMRHGGSIRGTADHWRSSLFLLDNIGAGW
jgi:hypothetical protein